MSVDLIGLVAGSGWAAGVNLHAVAVLLGLLGRLGLASVPATLMRTDVLAVAGALYAVEFVVDKVPPTSTACGTPCTRSSGRRAPPRSATC